MIRPRHLDPASSRARILAAAATEFAARGFAGAGVDRIARRARLNKAMIYYHFASKQALYREILHDMYRSVGARLDVILASNASPERKLGGFIDALVSEGEARPGFAPMMLRELAEGAPRLDRETLRLLTGLLTSIRRIMVEGKRRGVFRDVPPLVAHFAMVGPAVIYLASAPVRAEMGRLRLTDLAEIDSKSFIRHLQAVAARAFAKG